MQLLTLPNKYLIFLSMRNFYICHYGVVKMAIYAKRPQQLS